MDKAYIVSNKEQELDILKKFEQKGLVWANGETPTDWITSETDLFNYFASFPYALLDGDVVSWRNMNELDGIEIVYDGRKEEKMYKVTQEFMDKLVEWRDDQRLDMNTELIPSFLDVVHIKQFPGVVDDWWTDPENTVENNNRLITIIQWLNGEDVFEVEEPHKFVVRSDKSYTDGNYAYVIVDNGVSGKSYYDVSLATKFDTREEAQEWANSHQVIIEIGEEGNEVE